MSVSPEKMLSFSNVLLVVAAILTVIATISVIYFSKSVDLKKQNELKTYQGEADKRIADANANATHAHARADVSDKDLQDLRKQLNYRMLSSEQFKIIAIELGSLSPRKVQITCSLENREPYEYAKQLSRALEAAHWDTGSGTVRQPKFAADFGITIIAREDMRDALQNLFSVLHQASVQSAMHFSPVALAGYIQIFVGPKP